MAAPRIKKLPSLLVNQIAAGEVVERPASVVKELLENSIDACATAIDIDIEAGGKQLIRVRDNGCGMTKDELSLAVSSHATSKIACIEDLNHIASLGFRGEALASICAISRFTLMSNTATQQQAWQLLMDGRDEAPHCQPLSHPVGTTIEVRDLFFNTPARRRFLRTHKTEFSHIEEIVKRIALSHFELAIHLRHDGKTVLRVKAASDKSEQEQRIAKLFGQAFLQHALFIDTHITGLHLLGWLANSEYHRNSNDQQYFFINGRMVKDRLVAHALRQAYQDHLYPGKQPSYLLYLTIDPKEVDVNVHPTKHEVRFQDGRLVHDFIVRSLEQAFTTQTPKQPQILIREPAPHYQAPTCAPLVKKAKPTNDALPSKIIGVWQQRYLLLASQEQLDIIDITHAWTQLLRDKWRQAVDSGSINTKPLLIPLVIAVQQDDTTLNRCFDQLQTLGLLCELISEQGVVVRQIPTFLMPLNSEAALQHFFADDDWFKQELSTASLIAKLVDASVINIEYCLTNEAMQQLVDYLQQLNTDNYQQLTYPLKLSTISQHLQAC